MKRKVLATMSVLAACMCAVLWAAAQQPELPPAVPKPQLPDLDVTYIERTPKYPPGGDWTYPGDGRCIHVKEDPPVKHWPDPGEEVTFIAHVVNKGGAPSEEVAYLWMLDNETRNEAGWTGTLKPLEPGEEATVELKWTWSQDPHRVLIMVDPQCTLSEICERNNMREDWTHAKAIMIRVHPSIATAFDERHNAIGSYSFEDWIQEHFRIMNQMLAAAVWPSTPNGCLERVRIDPFKIASTEEMNTVSAMSPPYYADGGWQFHESPGWLAFALRCNLTSLRDDGLIHELTHQIGVIDNYGIESSSGWRDETDPEAPLMVIWFRSRRAVGLMGNESPVDPEGRPMTAQWVRVEPDTRVVQGRGIGRSGYSELEAAALNQMLDMRRGHFGLYLGDLAEENLLRILDRTGKPLPDATVSTFVTELPSRSTAHRPFFTGKTDSGGLVNLGAEPFGMINCLGINAFLFSRVEHPSLAAPEYHWVELADYNIACWRDGGERAVLDVMTGIGGPGAPKPPTAVRIEPMGGPVDAANPRRLVWEPSPSQDVACYRVYTTTTAARCHLTDVPMASRERPYGDFVVEVSAAEHSLDLSAPVREGLGYAAGTGYTFAVTAVDKNGAESSDAATPVPPQLFPREGTGRVQLVPPSADKGPSWCSAVLATDPGVSSFYLARFLADAEGKPLTTVEDECVLSFGIRTESSEPCVIAFQEAALGRLAVRVSGTGGLPEGAKEVGTLGQVSDGAWHDIKLDLKALLDKESGKTGPYVIGDVLFGNFAGEAAPAQYELRDVILRRR